MSEFCLTFLLAFCICLCYVGSRRKLLSENNLISPRKGFCLILEYLNVESKVEYMKKIIEITDRENRYPDDDDFFFKYFAY